MNAKAFIDTLPIMLQGMLGIFAVMIVIYLMIVALSKATKQSGE